MSNRIEVDPNFLPNNTIEDGMCFFDIETQPLKIYGVFKENGLYRRMPEEVARSVSAGVYNLHTNTAGGRVKFKTNSRKISVIAKFTDIVLRPHFAPTGRAGLDMYETIDGEQRYSGTFIPVTGVCDGFKNTVTRTNNKLCDITINMPLYTNIASLQIGFEEGSLISPPEPYKIENPIVFYGSSITQGGCANRAGTSYQGFISRALDCDYINLGFSGNAKGEDTMIDYIKGLSMSAFVYDYDHNAPDCAHLEATHEKMFKAIREAHPDIPVLMMSRPKFYLDDDEKKRLEIIRNTYTNALNAGDKNVYFIEGPKLMELVGDEGTVDGCHPTDLGFFSMATEILKVLKPLFR